jgi:hypothetical protein
MKPWVQIQRVLGGQTSLSQKHPPTATAVRKLLLIIGNPLYKPISIPTVKGNATADLQPCDMKAALQGSLACHGSKLNQPAKVEMTQPVEPAQTS